MVLNSKLKNFDICAKIGIWNLKFGIFILSCSNRFQFLIPEEFRFVKTSVP